MRYTTMKNFSCPITLVFSTAVKDGLALHYLDKLLCISIHIIYNI